MQSNTIPNQSTTQNFSSFVMETKREVTESYRQQWRSILGILDSKIQELNGNGISGKQFKDFTMHELSVIGGELALLRSSLIEFKSEVNRSVIVLESEIALRTAHVRDLIKEDFELKGKKTTVKDFEIELEKKMVKVTFKLKCHKDLYEKIQQYWYSIPDILKRIEQRIHILQGDKNTSHLYGERPMNKQEYTEKGPDFYDSVDNREIVFTN